MNAASASLLRRTVLLTLLLVWPFIPGVPYDMLHTGIRASEYLVIALSLVLLIGLVGQISLCQASLVGMGAFISAIFTLRFGVHFPATLLVGTVAGAATAAVIGVVALRVRGLFLAVATLIFAFVADQYLFVQPWLVQNQSGTSIGFESIGRPGSIPYFDLGDVRVMYFGALAVAVIAFYVVANLRDSRIGRAFAAVRGSEIAAASLGIAVVRIKLLAFGVAGGLAGLAGGLILVADRNVAPTEFNFVQSLFYLGIAVVGGLRSLGGAIASAIFFASLEGEVFVRYPKLADYLDLISAGLLILVLLFFRGGLGAVPDRLRLLGAQERMERVSGALARWLERLSRRRVGMTEVVAEDSSAGAPVDVIGLAGRVFAHAHAGEPTVDSPRVVVPSTPTGPREIAEHLSATDEIAGMPTPDGRRLPLLVAAHGVTVRFGGLTAVDDASIEVGAGEIVGLIGANGAGKTTLFNSILGLNQPAAGRVELYGHEVTTWPVHRRAALGVGRTFQILQLFSDLTVFDNLMVATHLQNRTGLFGSLLVTRRAREREAAARRRVRAVLRLMNLGHLADEPVGGLPFGLLRLIEVARTLVTGARLVCFDEPASGLDSHETDQLIEWFQTLRRMGITVLVIEHDVDMVMRLCDYVYVLDRGRLIANGTPAQVRRDPAVVAAYIGDDAEVA